MERILLTIDAVSEWSGKAISWLVLILTFVLGYEVVMRLHFQRTHKMGI
jgi:TRAP-type mannitol/chloroaromatic compound transport system permease small subunit